MFLFGFLPSFSSCFRCFHTFEHRFRAVIFASICCPVAPLLSTPHNLGYSSESFEFPIVRIEPPLTTIFIMIEPFAARARLILYDLSERPAAPTARSPRAGTAPFDPHRGSGWSHS
ncbi:hypothetical protein BV22DRAFT_848610 [Leucogyrophana mollusca]|uniref:Uncharacterized protein n=1 Tax=Leucogyrophana mollusca TaxID=85980 RepID=A0ACB8B2E1_9AGAM|nr:hypothetical protein BV22DRAFT_848610 [Leucogyrophana mollusca]